ncbi:hypothetical protein NE237_026748 [Protea cynaroides]|uniref:Uncharacterized protein n=1 Tax=Protea cynaroides TaxID=273540 RepID=A0A9Q0GL54_9MAGN|nr:hypothetical protein NE237_026748 [Protea cynaroides]
MDIAERLAQVGEEIQHVENDLRDRRFILTAFWRHLRPANPAVVGDRMRAMEQGIKGLERRVVVDQPRNEQQELLVQASSAGERPDSNN